MAEEAAIQRDDFAEAVTHLEYLGYHVSAQAPDGWCFAEHPLRYDIHVRRFPMGLRLNCAVEIGAEPGSSRAAWLEFLNAANERARMAQFSLAEGADGLLRVRMAALISGAYNRQVFSMMMDFWHEDLDIVRCKPAFPVSRDDEEKAEGADTPAPDASGSVVH